MEPLTIEKTTHPLNSTWVIWYHNPSDNNWETSSYKKLYEFNTLEDFFIFQNTWKNNLPKLNLSMMFMMKKLDNYEFIYPMWEDKNNQPGGCWSFKISKRDIFKAWLELSIALLGEIITLDAKESCNINGISISPKKAFSIIKIWNRDSNKSNNSMLSKKIPFILLNSSIYKAHKEKT